MAEIAGAILDESTTMSWTPKRSLTEIDITLCGRGMPHEIETLVVDGRVQRVYKNLWPSLREFWILHSDEYRDRTYIVFEQQRWTYGQVADRAAKAASLFKTEYGVRKGDRIAICSRNLPDFVVAWWACHLIGAVSVLVNAWLLVPALQECFIRTQSKLIIVDAERADRIETIVSKLMTAVGTAGFLVLDIHEGKGKWEGMRSWNHVLNNCTSDGREVLDNDPGVRPEDNAMIIFTSGTTGLPKGVLSTHRSSLTSLRNVTVGSARAALRLGASGAKPADGPPKGILVAVPLFHVIGMLLSTITSMDGMKLVLMRKWSLDEGSRLIKSESISVAGGVPTIVSDLIEGAPPDCKLDALIFGGAPVDKRMPEKAKRKFPDTLMSQAYGMTESSGVCVTFSGEDYSYRPTSTGLPCPVNDVLIVTNGKALPAGEVGEIWLRGPNVMKGYWNDPDATAKVLTKDGWLLSGDLGCVDEQGFLYVRDRMKDMIISGGENIDSVSVENALYADPRVLEAAAVGIPHERLGEVVVGIVSLKAAFQGKVSEKEIMKVARRDLPRFAHPVMIMVLDERFERTATEKIIKCGLRELARAEWSKRNAVNHSSNRSKM